MFGTATNSSVQIAGANPGDFTVDVSSLPNSLAAHSSAKFSITFTPGSSGLKTTRIIIPYDNGIKQQYSFFVKSQSTKETTTNVPASEDTLLLVYPNPSNGLFTIRTSLKNFDLRVYDMNGRLVVSESNGQSGNFILDLENKTKGIYLLQLKDDKHNLIKKLIVR
jgi:hypothetical protein